MQVSGNCVSGEGSVLGSAAVLQDRAFWCARRSPSEWCGLLLMPRVVESLRTCCREAKVVTLGAHTTFLSLPSAHARLKKSTVDVGYFALGVANHSVKLTETKLGASSTPKSWGIDSDTLLEQYELNGATRPTDAHLLSLPAPQAIIAAPVDL